MSVDVHIPSAVWQATGWKIALPYNGPNLVFMSGALLGIRFTTAHLTKRRRMAVCAQRSIHQVRCNSHL